MDNLAHTLVGVALARTRLARGVPFATLALAAGANLADVDALANLAGADAALHWRRGPTHGPLGLLLLPLALAAGIALATLRRRRRGQAVPLGRITALAYLGALTHPLLDLLNTYGIRLLSPFSERWSYGDVLFIVDPWLWLLLGGGVFLVRPATRRGLAGWSALALAATALLLSRPAAPVAGAVWLGALAAVALARRRAGAWLRARRELVAAAAVALAAAYVGAMTVVARVSEARVRAELAARGVGPVEALMVGPVPVDPFTRDVAVALPGSFRFGSWRWLEPRGLSLAERPVPALGATDDPRVAAAAADPSVAGFLEWARFPFARVEESPGGTRVHLLDGRYVRELPDAGRRFGTATVELPGP